MRCTPPTLSDGDRHLRIKKMELDMKMDACTQSPYYNVSCRFSIIIGLLGNEMEHLLLRTR